MLPARIHKNSGKADVGRRSPAEAFCCAVCGDMVFRADRPHIPPSRFNKQKYCGYACAHAAARSSPMVEWYKHTVADPSGCHLWTGRKTDRGYGIIWKDGKPMRAHRFSWEFWFGPIPAGEHVLHRCDVRNCVNPDHLFLGTHQDNMKDMAKKGRSKPQRGSSSNFAKLTEQDALAVLASSESGVVIARRLGVSKGAIYAIRNGKNWGHLHVAS